MQAEIAPDRGGKPGVEITAGTEHAIVQRSHRPDIRVEILAEDQVHIPGKKGPLVGLLIPAQEVVLRKAVDIIEHRLGKLVADELFRHAALLKKLGRGASLRIAMHVADKVGDRGEVFILAGLLLPIGGIVGDPALDGDPDGGASIPGRLLRLVEAIISIEAVPLEVAAVGMLEREVETMVAAIEMHPDILGLAVGDPELANEIPGQVLTNQGLVRPHALEVQLSQVLEIPSTIEPELEVSLVEDTGCITPKAHSNLRIDVAMVNKGARTQGVAIKSAVNSPRVGGAHPGYKDVVDRQARIGDLIIDVESPQVALDHARTVMGPRSRPDTSIRGPGHNLVINLGVVVKERGKLYGVDPIGEESISVLPIIEHLQGDRVILAHHILQLDRFERLVARRANPSGNRCAIFRGRLHGKPAVIRDKRRDALCPGRIGHPGAHELLVETDLDSAQEPERQVRIALDKLVIEGKKIVRLTVEIVRPERLGDAVA